MTPRFRPTLDLLEAREVPAAFSFRLPDGSIGSGLFSTTSDFDPAQPSQSLLLADLSVTKGGVAYTVQPGATATYANGILVGVNAVANGADVVQFNGGSVQVGASSAPLALDGATTQMTFELPDGPGGTPGTVGAISYRIPWELVDPTQANQVLPATVFNLNVAGGNLAYGSANYTQPPTLLFAHGEFVGVSFALTPAPGFAFTSFTATFGPTGGNLITAIKAGTGLQYVAAPTVKTTALIFTFSECGGAEYTYDLRISVTYADNTVKQVDIAVPNGTTATGLRDMIQIALKAEGVDARVQGENLVIDSTEKNNLKSVSFQADKDPQGILKPSILKLKQAGIVKTATLTPTWTVR